MNHDNSKTMMRVAILALLTASVILNVIMLNRINTLQNKLEDTYQVLDQIQMYTGQIESKLK